jgi:uncharacterized membrane protein
MKKLITISTACIIAGLWLTSCSSHMMIVKRHYNNGYYVSHVNHKATSTASATTVTDQPEITEVATKPSIALLPENLEQSAPVAYTNEATVNTQKERSHRMSAKTSVASGVAVVTDFMTSKTKEAAKPMSFNFANEIKAHKTDEVVREGLSLFWIIILILLILWVLGLLGGGWGLGILINLLLLFALILLILWLLRVL